MLLDTYMYLNYKEADDGMTLAEILSELESLPEYQPGGLHGGEYEILAKAVQGSELGELVIGNQSHLMGYDSGTAACTFSTADKSSVYVVYRGTGDGEWLDNGIGMTEKATLQQERALQYFEETVEREQIQKGQTVIVTGHSKGGNKAQFVTMSTKYHDLLDNCYNIDGQGFSEKAIGEWKAKYGESEYRERAEKIIGIYGENDYVNGLGISIVPKENVRYISTFVEKGNFAGYHDIKYLFASKKKNPITGKYETIFNGSKNPYVEQQKELGSYAATLSAVLMGMEPRVRDGCAVSLMQIMELGGSKKTGLNGEKISFKDMEEFLQQGIPAITKSLFLTEDGMRLLQTALLKDSFSDEMKGQVRLFVNDSGICRESIALSDMIKGLKEHLKQAEEIEKKLPEYLKESWFLCNRLKKIIRNLENSIQDLLKLQSQLEQCVKLYRSCDSKLADEILSC